MMGAVKQLASAPPGEPEGPDNPLAEYVKTLAQDRPLSDVLAEILRDRILRGDLLPGVRLIEAELSKLYGISRGPVREALRRLDTEGLIEIEKFRSPTVRGVDLRMFGQMFEVRSVLEGYACGLAARNLKNSKPDIAWARKQHEAWRAYKWCHDVDQHVKNNKEFHTRLLAIAGNELINAQIESLIMPGYRAILESKVSEKQMRASAEQHAAILAAVLDGDSPRAEQLMRAHILEASGRAAEAFEVEFLDPRMSELRRLREG